MKELDFILDFARNEDLGYDACCKQLRSLWTAYCLHNDLLPDTGLYDNDLLVIWNVVKKNTTHPWIWTDRDSEENGDAFESFDLYMGSELC